MLNLVPTVGPSWDRKLWDTVGGTELGRPASRLVAGNCQCFLGSCHSQPSLTGGHQFRSETHHGYIWSSGPPGPLQAAPCHGLACTGQSVCSWEASQETSASALATVVLPFFNHFAESSIAWWYRNTQAQRGPWAGRQALSLSKPRLLVLRQDVGILGFFLSSGLE